MLNMKPRRLFRGGPGPRPRPNYKQATKRVKKVSAEEAKQATYKSLRSSISSSSSQEREQQPQMKQPNIANEQPATVTTKTTTTTNKEPHVCAGCRKLIRDKFLLEACDKYWHQDCLKCHHCQVNLDDAGRTLYVKDELTLCRQDYLEMFGQTAMCSVCEKLIYASELVMRAKQNVYHLECFACQLCGQRFCVGDRFYLFENKIVCQFDYEEHILPLQSSLLEKGANNNNSNESIQCFIQQQQHDVNCNPMRGRNTTTFAADKNCEQSGDDDHFYAPPINDQLLSSDQIYFMKNQMLLTTTTGQAAQQTMPETIEIQSSNEEKSSRQQVHRLEKVETNNEVRKNRKSLKPSQPLDNCARRSSSATNKRATITAIVGHSNGLDEQQQEHQKSSAQNAIKCHVAIDDAHTAQVVEQNRKDEQQLESHQVAAVHSSATDRAEE